MKKRFSVLFSFVFGLFLLILSLQAMYPSQIPVIKASLINPELITFSPPANSHTVDLTETISLVYDQPLDPSTINSQTIIIHTSQSYQAGNIYEVNTNQVSITQAFPFYPGELVQIIATKDVLNLAGEGPISSTVWGFRTNVNTSLGLLENTGRKLDDVGAGTSFIELGDLDGDNDLDALIIATGPNILNTWSNDGNGYFINAHQSFSTISVTREIDLGDLDGDGDLDAFLVAGPATINVGNPIGSPNQVWFNDGSGYFTDSGQKLGSLNSYGVRLGDLDGDGDLDAFVANFENTPIRANKVWLNDGEGLFIDSGQELGDTDSEYVDLGDLDNDGDLDAFVVNTQSTQSSQIWLNNGDGSFFNSGQNLGTESAGLMVSLGDLNNDGYLDAFVAKGNAQPTIWLNDGMANFTLNVQDLTGVTARHVALGDIDGDHDLDAIVIYPFATNDLLINDGQGNFSVQNQYFGEMIGRNVALGDLDGNKTLDMIVLKNYMEPEEIWLNASPISGLSIMNNSPTPLGSLTTLTATVIEGTNITYTWDLGDGVTKTGAVVTHTYPNINVYSVTVTATNIFGNLTATAPVTISQITVYLPFIQKP